MNEILLYVGASIIFVWGIAHIMPTKGVVEDFKLTDSDKRLILTMEWVAEGITLCFIGVIVFLVTAIGDTSLTVSKVVYISSAAMLIIMAIWTLLTGARTPVVPIKICPAVKTLVALLFVLALLL